MATYVIVHENVLLRGDVDLKSKKRFLTLLSAVILLFADNILSIKASGGINGNESRVIGVASGTFEYDGEMYKAAAGYVGQLTSYLSKDGVDLTAAQADAAISKIYANVATGVREGYIVKISGGDNEGSDNDDKPQKTKKPKKTEEPKPDKTPAPTKVPAIVNNPDGSVDVNDTSGDKVASFSGNMKNTGYSIKSTYVFIRVIATLLVVLCIYCISYVCHRRFIRYRK